MRVLLDENLPHDLIAALSRHDILTVQGMGWAGVDNGELLRRASGQIDAFMTMDRKLERQQNVGAHQRENQQHGVGHRMVVVDHSLLRRFADDQEQH